MIYWDKKARRISWLGIDKDTYERFNNIKGSYKWRYDVNELGFKYHGNSIQAAIGLVQLKYLDEDNNIRRQIAEKYTNLLKDEKHIEIVPVAPNCFFFSTFISNLCSK